MNDADNIAAVGTHDIKTAEILPSTINIIYFIGSNVRGALLNQVCITDTDANVSTPMFQTVHRSLHPIPYNLMALTCSGQVQIFLYDIEGSGTLSRGRNYPAVKQRVVIDRQGTIRNKFRSMSKFHHNVAWSCNVCTNIIGTDVLPDPESILFHLRNCSVETFPLLIRVKCEILMPW